MAASLILASGSQAALTNVGINIPARAQAAENEVSLVTPPEELKTETLGFTYDGMGHMVEAGFNEEEVYIKGLSNDFPDAWVKGFLSTGEKNTISIPSLQYVGQEKAYGIECYLIAVTPSDDGNFNYVDNYILDYDTATRTMTSGQDLSLCLYSGAGALAFYHKGMIRPQPEVPELSLKPASALDVQNQIFFYFTFNLSNLNDENYILDPNKLYYKIFVDDMPFTFTPDDYMYVEEPMTYLPFLYHDGNYDIHNLGKQRAIFLYFTKWESMGVQLYYIEGDINGEHQVLAQS